MIIMDTDFMEIYLKWLKNNFKSEIVRTDLGQFTQITTPFLDRHNDHLQIYIQQKEHDLFLTDGGYILNDLEMSGCDVLSSEKRKSVLSTIINGLGVQLQGEELCAKANLADFAQKKHSLLQAMLSVNDMFFLSRSQVSNIFLEDVQLFFDANYVPYVANAQFCGASGLSHTFDFTIPATRKNPERFIKTINDASREKVSSAIFSWEDIKEMRKPGTMLYVIMNDTEKRVRSDVMNALTVYGGTPVLWSEREKYIDKLAS